MTDRRVREMPGLVAGALRLVWHAGRRELRIVVALQVAAAAATAVQFIAVRRALHLLVSGGGLRSALGELATIVACWCLVGVASVVQSELARVIAELVARDANARLLDASAAADVDRFDTADFHDRLERAGASRELRALQIVHGLLGILGSAGAVAAIGVALVFVHPALVLLAAGYVPVWSATARNTRALYRFAYEMTPADRRRRYLSTLLTSREAAKEIRAYDLSPVLRERYDALADERVDALRAVVRTRLVRGVAATAGAAALMASTLGALGALFASGRISLSSAATAAAALLALGGRLHAVSAGAGALFESALHVADLEELPQSRDRVLGPAVRPFESLRAERVSFAYAGADEEVLRDVSVEIRRGEIVAVVGENGSGKTTLAKLLAHVYRPTSGRVLWDGATRDPAAVRDEVAVVFQDFQRYLLAAHDNVAFGRHARTWDAAAVREAARDAGADFLARDWDAVLGSQFEDGHDLSGGQWQRVALARALFRDAPFVVLDEPSASLDPSAEDDLFETIRRLSGGRTVLLVTHRLTGARHADRIYVMDRGTVVEHGTHDVLLERDGLYARLWRLQAAPYASERTRLEVRVA